MLHTSSCDCKGVREPQIWQKRKQKQKQKHNPENSKSLLFNCLHFAESGVVVTRHILCAANSFDAFLETEMSEMSEVS